MVGEIKSAGNGADDRHDDVGNQRIDDLAKGGADDDADGEINDIAPHGKAAIDIRETLWAVNPCLLWVLVL